MKLTKDQEESIRATTCPGCQASTLTVEYRLRAQPLGTFSLAGQQLKFSALEWPWVVCPGCGAEAEGKVTPR